MAGQRGFFHATTSPAHKVKTLPHGMVLFPVYALADSTGRTEQRQISKVNAWAVAALDDGSYALLVFDSAEKASACQGGQFRSVVMIESAAKFSATLKKFERENSNERPTKICWNMRPDGSFGGSAAITDILAMLNELPPGIKGS